MSATNGRKGTPRAGTVKHKPEVIARVIALLALGCGTEDVAKQTELPVSTVSTWRKYLPSDLEPSRTKKETIEDLFTQYLERGLEAALAQLKVASDPAWIQVQNAADLSLFHGVLFDKLARVFDSAKRGAELREAAGQLPAASS